MAVQKLSSAGQTARPAVVTRVKVSLPTALSVPPSDPSAFTHFIYGEQKVGKTSFTMQFPGCLHFMFEPSGKDYKIFQVAPNSWEEFEAYLELLEEKKREGALEYKTFAIDTVDLCYVMCADAVCRKAGVAHLSDGDFGKLYHETEEVFRAAMLRLAKLGGFIALSHSTEKEIETRVGTKYSVIVPSAGKRANLVLAKFCDIIGNYRMTHDGKRELLITPSAEYEAGHRLENHFMHTDGTPVQSIPMGKSAKEAYANYRKAFDNQLPVPEKKSTPAPVQSATGTTGNKPAVKLR